MCAFSACMYLAVCELAIHGGQKRALGPLRLELQSVKHRVGIKPRTCARAATALKH